MSIVSRMTCKVLACAAGLYLATGLSSASAQGPVVVRFGEIKGSLAFVPHEVAKGLGLFKKLEDEKKITLKLAGFTAGADETRSLAAGQLDMASSMYIEIAVPMAMGEPLKNVLVFNNAGTTSLLMSTKYKSEKLADLSSELGRPIKVGITSFGSGSDLLARTFLQYSNVAPKNYQIIPLGGTTAFYAAMEQGRVDVAQASEPAAQLMADRGLARFVVDGWDRTGLERLLGTRLQINGVHARDEFIKQHPQVVQAVVDVMLEAMDYIRANKDQPEKIIALLPDDLKKQVQGDSGDKVLRRVLAALSPDGCASTEAAIAVQKSLEAADMLKPSQVDWSKYYTKEFLRGACK